MTTLAVGADAAAGADPDARRGADVVRRPQAAAAARHHRWPRCRWCVAVCAALVYLADRDGTLPLQVGGWGRRNPAWGRWASRWWWIGCRR